MKIAVVGTGTVARDCYLPALSAEPDVELSYFNRTREKAEACAATFGGAVCASLDELMDGEPDSVFVLTNETSRADVLAGLLDRRPRRLFMEKPLVARNGQDQVDEEDYRRGSELMSRAAQIGCETAMIFNYRFFDQSLAVDEILRSRDFGLPLQATAIVNYACWSHSIDLIHHFVGSAHTVSALDGPKAYRHGGSEAKDVLAAITFENGATGTIHGTWALDFGFPLYELIVNFERGRVHLRGLDGDLEVLDYASAPARHETISLTRNTSRWDQYNASFGKSIRAYLRTLREATPPPIAGVAGLEELQFEAALRRSAREGRPITLDEELPLGARAGIIEA